MTDPQVSMNLLLSITSLWRILKLKLELEFDDMLLVVIFPTMASARLSNLKRLLRETTQEAYQSIVPTNDSIITPPGSDISTKPEDDASGDANKAGHEMGLLLFGTSREYKEQMENEFTEKLEGIEREVASIREELGQLQGSSGGARDVSMTMEATNDGAEEIDLSSLNPTELQNHIEFLQLCSSSQRLLDQVDSTSFSSEKVALDFSPSSMLFSPSSSTNGKFNFDNANQGGSVESAAKLVLKVEGELDKATRLLDMDNNEEENQIHEMHLAIYNELRFQFRRKKMELKHRAISTLEGCIVVELGKLCVRGAVGTKKNVNFGDFDTAAPATPRENAIHSPLGDAYVVLEVFNNDQYPVLGETLDQAIKTIGKQLFGQVFQPTLKELDMSNGSVGYYKFNQEIVKNSIGSRKYDTAVTRGQAIQLLWEMNKVASSVSFTAGKPDVIISTSTEINEAELLASSPLASVTNFISCLNFVLKVLEFVHEHVLLQRTDLAKLLGNYLFGLYPISPSLSAGSAILGGVLVGAAAQGEDTGEVRPLMVELVKCMRDWCIPDDSNVEVWRTVPKIQRVLVQEVSAFEDRLVEMGYLNARENVRKFGAASSPTGLSVLVNQDGIRSPIDVNLTVNRDSPMEVSSPPTEQDKENMFVRSSLSEIAHSFIQAYSENQRSKILRHGRTVLDSTDYHNSVQVGKFVPPPSEPGTLEHLDEDPLDAFVFHQCSISLTAQKTLQLVRQTLDEAVQPEMSQELDALPPMLYRASRELLDLFRAVVPTLYASEIGTIPRMAAIHHNDCVFLAHEASLLGELVIVSDFLSPLSCTHLS
jgi:hypothetical protein